MRARFVAAIGVLTLALASSAGAQHLATYEVTITNLTRDQVFSNPLVVTHTDDVALFAVGTAASPELALLAEDGVPDDLATLLAASAGVADVAVAGTMVPPGASVTLEVLAAFPFHYVSAVGMLVSTNDAFFGLDGLRVPERNRAAARDVPAYDAGSETNNENCGFIPGPPCGNPGVRDTSEAEGFVHIHAGIHGVGSLNPAVRDWRNPVARITIRLAD